MPRHKPEQAKQSPLKLLLWTAMIGLVIGLVNAGAMFEDLARTARNKAHGTKASGDIVLVAIDAGDQPEDVGEFVENYGLTFPVWLDPTSQTLDEFRTNSLPSSYLVDRQGKIRGLVPFGTPADDIARDLELLLKMRT